EEAAHGAALFGGSFSTFRWTPDGDYAMVTAIVGAGDTQRCLERARQSLANGFPFINTGCSDDRLRGAVCAKTMFHVAPSDAMQHDAGEAAVAWDSSLERFGADTLNRRFLARFGQPMTDAAWAAWFAV